jgi:hypothetical protein
MSAARERPILFSAPMTRALLAGTKTQTRRIAKGTVEDVVHPDWYGARRLVHKPTCQRSFCETVDFYELACGGYDCEQDGRTLRSPYGAPGDCLWVRETWCYAPADTTGELLYRADAPAGLAAKWRPSIFMPRGASRIDLEIVSVRVERLQDISEADACSEGIEGVTGDLFGVAGVVPFEHHYPDDAYCRLWGSINGAGSWALNPWVWVVAFRVLSE